MLNKKAIVLDYGHGGRDSGAYANGVIEKKANLVTGKACKEELEKYDVTVYETRKEDEYLSIEQRCAIANKTNAAYFCSIHHNAGGGDRAETIHSILGGDSKDMAVCIAKELKKSGQDHVKVYDKKGNGNKDYYGVIRGTKMAACIVEVAFLDNINDVQFVDTIEDQKRNGVAIAHGILDEMGIPYKEQSVNKPNNNKEYEKGNYNRKAIIQGTPDGFLNVRKARKDFRDESIIGIFKEGQEITVNYCKDNWFSTWDCKNQEGYISGVYVKLLN